MSRNKGHSVSSGWLSQVRPALPGLFLAVLTILFGFGLGTVFGLNEAIIKDRLAASAAEVQESAYSGDEEAMQAVVDKSWSYMKRAHLHAGSIGTTAIALILLLLLLRCADWMTCVVGLFLGLGGLGYSIFWLLAGFRAPGMGGTGAAKESLSWLAMPSSGAVVFGTIAVSVLVLTAMIRVRSPFQAPLE